jgi:hypothetical protein
MDNKTRTDGPKPFMLRLTDEDKAHFIVASRQDGFEELAAWFRWLARIRVKLAAAESAEASSKKATAKRG